MSIIQGDYMCKQGWGKLIIRTKRGRGRGCRCFPLVSTVLLLFLLCFLLAGCGGKSSSAPDLDRRSLTREDVLKQPERYITVGKTNCDFSTLREAIEDVRQGRNEIVLMDPVHTEGGIFIDRDLVLHGLGRGAGEVPGATVLQASSSPEEAADRVLQIEEGVTVMIRDLIIRHGNAPGPYRSGGGIRNYGSLILEYCSARDNLALYGAGILNSGTLTMRGCTVADNHTLPITMAELKDATGCTGSGGGIKNEPGARMELNSCTISGNSSLRKGGGLFLSCESMAVLSNCTISGNESRQPGGGVHIRGDAEMVHCTITGNHTKKQGGGVYNLGHLDMTACIIAGNEYTDFVIGSGGGIYGTGEMGTDTYNLVADGGRESALSGDPGLGPLYDNGGPTLTHALPRRSPAVDVIPRAELRVDKDQRGMPRQGKAGDIGAFER